MDDRSEAGLLCNEELLLSPHPSPFPPLRVAPPAPFYPDREERDEAFALCLQRESSFVPDKGYSRYLLSSGFMAVRLKAVVWIKTHARMNLSTGSVFYAVNYLDRFLSLNRGKKWKDWMPEVLSAACLSIAVKLNDVTVPSLQEFQKAEDLQNTSQHKFIQQTELTVMKTLGWRLSAVTPYSYVDLMTWQQDSVQAAMTPRVTELLLAALTDSEFIDFRPFAVAAAALKCSLEELLPSKAASLLSELTRLLPHSYLEEIERCHKAMEERVVDPLCTLSVCGHSSSPSSPVTVMALKESGASNSCVHGETLTKKSTSATKKRKRVHFSI